MIQVIHADGTSTSDGLLVVVRADGTLKIETTGVAGASNGYFPQGW